ncbi:MAG: hypothetical protein K8W52_16785 [Deltaproteobacteria bacterium]|nr:hypothetical protein [Deltaproteobacteria bacterium]
MRASICLASVLTACGHASIGPVATPLRGPFASVDAACAAVTDAHGSRCAPLEMERTSAAASRLAVVHIRQPDRDAARCAVVLATDRGWFITATSADACSAGSIDPGDVATNPLVGAAGTQIDIGAAWHSPDFADEARYTLTTLCGVVDGVPACTPIFTSACEDRAPAGACRDRGYALRWTIADGAITFTSSRDLAAGADVRALLGAHRLGF